MQPVHQAKTTGHGPRTTNKRGFTLVEILMVILILAALIAMLLPAIASVRSRVLQTRVRTEISNIENAIGTFRATYGVEPPSRLIICEDETVWNAIDPSPAVQQLKMESKAALRRIWPNISFGNSATGANTGGMPQAIFAANSPMLTLYGDECLVFFLGGMADSSGALIGFSTNPSLPFSVPGPGSNQTRKGPFLEFETDRIKASTNINGARVYVDPIAAKAGHSTGYIYLSSRDGRGYNVLDYPPIMRQQLQNVNTNLAPAIYGPSGSSHHKPKGFQIISAGGDGEYGQGGIYTPDKADQLLIDNLNATPPIYRAVERDNITNFHDGQLGG